MIKNYDKTKHDQTFDRWNNLKKSLDKNDRAPGFNAGEINKDSLYKVKAGIHNLYLK